MNIINKKLYIVMLICCLGADYQTKNQPNITSNRNSVSQKIGNQTITRRSDGTKSINQPLGSNRSLTIEQSRSGKQTKGITQQNGNQSITTWSNGDKTVATKSGNNSTVQHFSKNKTTTGLVTKNPNGSTTRWNNGTTNINKKVGGVTLNSDSKK